MTTRNPQDPTAESMSGRRTRPRMERTGPNRSIFNAFRQADGAGDAPVNGHKFEDNEIWGASSGTGPDLGGARAAASGAGRLWNDSFEAVRAAYGVVDEQIRAGYEEAARLSRDDGMPKGQRFTKVLNRLVQTYSDLGTQWIDLVRAVADSRESQSGSSAAAAAPAQDMSLAVELTTARPAKARALLYRHAVHPLSAWPLRREGGAGEITGVTVAAGPAVVVEIPAGTPPGLYRGIIVEEGVEEPAGSVIVTVLDNSDG